MRYYRFVISVAIALLVVNLSIAEEEYSANPFIASPEIVREIKNVIFDKYIGGQIAGRADVIKDAFSPDAVMLSPVLSDESSLYRWLDMHSEADKWGATANSNIDINKVKILKLDIIDERLATAQINMLDRVFEVVTLVKTKNGWKIASKVYVPQQ
ncbi:hypothetical protein KUL152_32290 [Tenacibaculum sp. KUL152]|nr:hypothetical protein KUL152_32290 [Tenacibaculum sp. KUL152]GFD94564.1 hypothetical protein KUL154_32970 [Alteromonas sp. KUL154]GFD97577.1 hypothetical protein KUL156_01700 [Alteromonas sp. KUL156]